MDIILAIIGLGFAILGIIGAFLPILPGPITGWLGLLILHLTKAIEKDWSFLGITLAIAVAVWVLDYIIPAIGTKKFGGTSYGVWGSTIGLIVGMIAPIPFGIIIGPFFGAFIGELMYDNKNKNRALKASIGSFIGFLASTGIKFGVGLVYCWLYISIFWEHKQLFF